MISNAGGSTIKVAKIAHIAGATEVRIEERHKIKAFKVRKENIKKVQPMGAAATAEKSEQRKEKMKTEVLEYLKKPINSGKLDGAIADHLMLRDFHKFGENEYKVDMLVARGIIATTSGGAQSVEAADWQPLAGRDVLIWPDNDKPGFEYAQHASDKLRALGCIVSFVDVAALGLPSKGDCVDWLKAFQQQHGRKATAGDIWALPVIERAPEKTDPVVSRAGDSNKGGKGNAPPQSFAPLPVVQITCAADIKPEPIRWVWVGYIARGKFHVFAGMAGDGKTTIAIALVATISVGGRFPDGTRAPVGNVLVWSGEDSAQDTLVPRLLAAGADMSRVHFIGDVKHGDETRSFDPATDIKAMADAASGLMRSHEARRREAAAATEGNQRVTARKPMVALCLRRSVRYHCDSRQLTASSWRGFFREGRSGEVAAETERTHLATELKQRAGSSPSALCPMPVR